ncbi:hypothetical protein EW145_g2071 [Phellinidium pouzarii]|uniref:Histone H1 n=1 Tax=Phellinidium pouzarii TaxID=167371 RepID=A0A4S4LE51_9AGAM|nr:hypothetical protein EW145_g2071 [Phellinidium pouzarii]
MSSTKKSNKSRVSTTKESAPKPTAAHPSWTDMIKACIIDHPEEARSGVSRPQIKKYVETKYKLQIGAAQTSQLNRAIASGAEKRTFFLPKGPSGKVKLPPKRSAESTAAKENKPAAKLVAKPKTKITSATKAKTAAAKTAAGKKTMAKLTSKPTTSVKKAPTKAKRVTAKRTSSVKRPAKRATSGNTRAKTAANKPRTPAKKVTKTSTKKFQKRKELLASGPKFCQQSGETWLRFNHLPYEIEPSLLAIAMSIQKKMDKRKRNSEESEAGQSNVRPDAKKIKPASVLESGRRPAQSAPSPLKLSSKAQTASICGKDLNTSSPKAGALKSRLVEQEVSKDTTDKKNISSDSRFAALRIRKLVPPRPFPTVPTSVSATGPQSAHTEGKNRICITRRTPLGAYLRRCKDVILKDGYKTLHLHALGAAIPHLSRLAISLPPILPFPPDEIHTEVLTGTAELQDEIIPDDEDEDITLRTRGKSTMSIVIKIGDGEQSRGHVKNVKNIGKSKSKRRGQLRQDNVAERMKTGEARIKEFVFQEADLDDDIDI